MPSHRTTVHTLHTCAGPSPLHVRAVAAERTDDGIDGDVILATGDGHRTVRIAPEQLQPIAYALMDELAKRVVVDDVLSQLRGGNPLSSVLDFLRATHPRKQTSGARLAADEQHPERATCGCEACLARRTPSSHYRDTDGNTEPPPPTVRTIGTQIAEEVARQASDLADRISTLERHQGRAFGLAEHVDGLQRRLTTLESQSTTSVRNHRDIANVEARISAVETSHGQRLERVEGLLAGPRIGDVVPTSLGPRVHAGTIVVGDTVEDRLEANHGKQARHPSGRLVEPLCVECEGDDASGYTCKHDPAAPDDGIDVVGESEEP